MLNFSIKTLRPNVYYIESDSRFDIGMLFLRYSEHYESPYSNIRNNNFSIVDYMRTYVSDRKDLVEEPTFDYSKDWSGYNFPLENITKVLEKGIPDPNIYDSLMLGYYNLMKHDSKGQRAYVIGGFAGNDAVLLHEMSHAMFHIDVDYADKIEQIGKRQPGEYIKYGVLSNLIMDKIHQHGYAKEVLVDELQAYVLTCREYIDLWVPERLKKLEKEFHKEILTAYKEHMAKFYEPHVKLIDDICI